ncbi:hypothetical protein Lser_V15G20563 [Lactuca serriola]
MFYDMGYIDLLTTVTKFKKSCLPPQWNGLFTLLFKAFAERVAWSDGASKALMTLLYGIYHDINLDYGSILWSQLVQSLNFSSRHSEISCSRFWTLITHRSIEKFNVPIMVDALRSSIGTFHTIIVSDPTKFAFVGSIPESMYRCVFAKSKVIREYIKLPSSGPRHLTPEMQSALDVVDKPAKRGKKPDQKKQEKEGQSSKASTSKKRKAEQAAPSAPKKRKVKKMVRKLKEASPNDSDFIPSDHDQEQSDEGEGPTTTPCIFAVLFIFSVMSRQLRKKQKRMKSAHLCDELIVEIFTRLPSKSLLRFRSLSKSCIILWNPSIRRKLTLPDCPRTCYSEVEIGFGFDPVIDDYKIVCMPESNGKKAGRSFVYALKTNIWRRIASPTPLFSYVMTKPCFFNGVLYWLGHYDLTRTYYLLTFDLSTHVFGSIALPFKTVLFVAPTPIQGSIAVVSSVAAPTPIQGSIAVVSSVAAPTPIQGSIPFANQIWLMKDASWSAFLNFKKDQVRAHLSSVLQLSTSDDLVFYSFCNRFQVYNLKIGEFSRLVNFNRASFVFDVIECLESLQLLGMRIACEGNKLTFS